ncbi:unnamed protein product [Aphanomyces euteiches]
MARPHFFRVNCSHSELFRDSYIRCYQNNGLKIIRLQLDRKERLISLFMARCFPHCCPHMEYRGCGASLSLQIDVIKSTEFGKLHAFGRFEVVAEPAIAEGELVDWTIFSSDLRSKKNAFGMWLQGHRQVDEPRAAVFHFNKSRTDGWHYKWHSGSSKQKRNELHRFHVYVVRRESDTECSIVLSAYSTPFSLSSYRRAPGNKFGHDTMPSEKTQRKLSKPQQNPHDRGLAEAEKIVRLFDICSKMLIDDVPPQQWAVLEETLHCRCVSWSGLNIQPTAMQIIPDRLRNYLQKPWTVANEIALKLLWIWFDKTTFEFCQQIFKEHSECENHRAAYVDSVEVFYDTFVVKNFKNNMDALEKILKNRRSQKSTSQADNKCYEAFVCAFRESAMDLINFEPHRAALGCNGLWHLQHVSMRNLDVRPSVYNFFRSFTMFFALNLRMKNNLLFVQSKLLMFPAPWSKFHLDGKAATFHNFPNGESCGLDQAAMVGDYKAWVEFGTIQLWIYRWPKANQEKCYLLRVWIAPCALDPNILRISWMVEEAATTISNFNALQAEDRMKVWDDMEHTLVLQADTVYSRVDSTNLAVSV